MGFETPPPSLALASLPHSDHNVRKGWGLFSFILNVKKNPAQSAIKPVLAGQQYAECGVREQTLVTIVQQDFIAKSFREPMLTRQFQMCIPETAIYAVSLMQMSTDSKLVFPVKLCAFQDSEQRTFIYIKGCVPQFEKWLQDNLTVVAGIFIGIALLQVRVNFFFLWGRGGGKL